MYVNNDIFHDMLGRWWFAYLDDVLIYSKVPKQHTQHVKAVFSPVVLYIGEMCSPPALYHITGVRHLTPWCGHGSLETGCSARLAPTQNA